MTVVVAMVSLAIRHKMKKPSRSYQLPLNSVPSSLTNSRTSEVLPPSAPPMNPEAMYPPYPEQPPMGIPVFVQPIPQMVVHPLPNNPVLITGDN